MKEVPVKIEHGGKWVSGKIGIGEAKISLGAPVNKEIPIKSIDDLEVRKNVLIISIKGAGGSYKIASVPKVLTVIKKFILMSCSAYRLMAYFMSPAVRGGVMVKNAIWEKGAVAVLKSGIWFVGSKNQVCIPLADVSGIEPTTRDVQGKDSEVVKIDHIGEGEVLTSYVLCPPTTLQVLYNFLKDATKGLDLQSGDVDSLSAQVAMLVYSGMDSHAIEGMVNISHKQIETVYDKLLKLNMAEVVMTRREIKLTATGVRYVNEAVKQ